MYQANILADSIGPHQIRLTTFEVTFPRFILAEVNTHRVLSRNSASSRAIPTEKQIDRVLNYPFIPEFNERVKGMGVGEPLTGGAKTKAQAVWLGQRDQAIVAARELLHVDKSRANRLLEPFMWHTAIISATEWKNFFHLRNHEAAQPEFRKIAQMMEVLYLTNEPERLDFGEWHLPLFYEEDGLIPPRPKNLEAAKVSAGRCARVSYDRHNDTENPLTSIERWGKLSASGHWSPGEHPAICTEPIYHGNFKGWRQLRKFYEGEAVFERESGTSNSGFARQPAGNT